MGTSLTLFFFYKKINILYYLNKMPIKNINKVLNIFIIVFKEIIKINEVPRKLNYVPKYFNL